MTSLRLHHDVHEAHEAHEDISTRSSSWALCASWALWLIVARWRGHTGAVPVILALTLGVVSARPTPIVAQHYEHPLPADFNEPIRLYTAGLGKFSRPISAANP